MIDNDEEEMLKLAAELYKVKPSIKIIQIMFEFGNSAVKFDKQLFRDNVNAKLASIGFEADGQPNGDEISMLILTEGSMVHGPFASLTVQEIKAMLDTNIYHTGLLINLMIKRFYQRALEGKKSAIVTVSSSLSQKSTPGTVMYSASKAFVTFFTVALGAEMIAENFSVQNMVIPDENLIDIQCLCPGPISESDKKYTLKNKSTLSRLIHCIS